MLPSGTDHTFGRPLPFADNGGGILFRRCLGLASCRARFSQQLAEISSVMDGLNLQSRVDALAATLSPSRSEPSRESPSTQQWTTALQGTRTQAGQRTLTTAARRLRAAHCKVGTVSRVGRSRLRVKSTFPRHKTVCAMAPRCA